MADYKILDVKLQTISQTLLKELLSRFLETDNQHHIVTVNAEFIVQAQTDQNFKNILNDSSLSTIDGSGPILALQLLGQKISLEERLTGVQLTDVIINLATNKNYKILFGCRTDGLTTPQQFTEIIKNKYPTLDFQVCIIDQVVGLSQSFQPDILLINLGAPKQEYRINENLPKIPSIKIAVGIGGTLDFISGQMRRAPKIMRSFGLEWLWRLLQQPKRIKRIWRAVAIFPYLVIKDKYKKNN